MKEYVVVRSYDAGVFAGHLEEKNGMEVTLSNCRRIWYWEGAASLSQLAMEGVKSPESCKFSIPVKKQIILKVCEIIYSTKKAEENIKGVKEWKM